MNRQSLAELLSYDPDTGIFVWRRDEKGWIRSGEVAGCIDREGYRVIGVRGRRYFAHRLAWLYIYGYFPTELDHKDLDKSNNRIANLRIATRGQNLANRTVFGRNKLGIKGVTKVGSKFKARVAGKYLGVFDSAGEAAEAYLAEATKTYGEFSRARESC